MELCGYTIEKWATAWENQQTDLCPQQTHDQPRKMPRLICQTGRMPRLILVFAGHTCHFVCFVVLWLKCIKKIWVYTVCPDLSGWKFRTITEMSYVCMKTESNITVMPNVSGNFNQLSPVKRICVFEHSVMTNFNCACPAIQRGQGSGFLFEGSSWLTACMSEQRRFWQDCADAQARLNLRCSHRR